MNMAGIRIGSVFYQKAFGLHLLVRARFIQRCNAKFGRGIHFCAMLQEKSHQLNIACGGSKMEGCPAAGPVIYV